MEIFFWILVSIIVYSYVGYPLLLFLINSVKEVFKLKSRNISSPFEPEVTLFISAYNEIDFINQKVTNSFSLDYPKDKIHHIWITDGSNDGTPEALKKFEAISVYHQNERKGKTGAINRGMRFVKTPIVILSDANTLLNKEAIRIIVNEFKNSKVGCVAGEKRISPEKIDNAVNSGEGIYWKYESFLKNNESNLNSALGAVGELFAIRTDLFEEIEPDTILDDFIISLRIAQKGYKIKYAPNAYATERASANINEELKRKTRIAYGGFQAIFRLKGMLNPIKHPFLSFQFFSHKIMRWTIVPFSFILIFFTNAYLFYIEKGMKIFSIIFLLQILFYFIVFIGYLFQSKKIGVKIIFAPYYVFIMNLSQIIGFVRFLKKNQSVNWERAKRE